MRFVVPVATVNAGANPRYFGQGRCLTWLNYLNDQVAGIGAVVVPGTVRDSLHILDGLLDLDGGQIRQSYREGQEDQLGALGLVMNAVILWNTRYTDATLAELRGRGASAADEDEQRLSPLVSEHINMLGRYTFTDAPAGAPLRPFRHSDEDREN